MSKFLYKLSGRAVLAAGFAVSLFYQTNLQAFPTIHVVDQAQRDVPHAVVSLPGSGPATARPSTMDQVNNQFSPHVLAVPVNTEVRFPNSDDTRHHVYSFSEAKNFELKLYRANEAPPVQFDKPGLVTLGCNIHDQMIGYIYVADTPWFAVSDAKGRATLPEGAKGDTVSIWHSQLKAPVSHSIDEQDSSEVTLTLPFTLVTADAPTTTGKPSLEERLKQFKRNAN